jgi:hypothetical protein
VMSSGSTSALRICPRTKTCGSRTAGTGSWHAS